MLYRNQTGIRKPELRSSVLYNNQWIVLYHGDMQISGLCCTTDICKSVDCAVPRRYANQWIVLYHGDMQISGLCCTTEIVTLCTVCDHFAHHDDLLLHSLPQEGRKEGRKCFI